MTASWKRAKDIVKAVPVIGPAARYVYRLFRAPDPRTRIEQQNVDAQGPVPRPADDARSGTASLAGRSRVTLRYTSRVSHAEFQARCREHDFWYHSYYFDNGFAQPGHYDIGPDVADYGFPQDMSGMSVLDIGTGSGWFAAWFEQHGADVTVTDARGLCDLDIYGRDHYPDLALEKPRPDRLLSDGRPVYYSSCSKGFWIMKDILALKAQYVNARVYDICPELFGGRKFDLVFMGSVLMHLRDPIGGLMAAHRVCRHELIATSYMLPPQSPQTVTLVQALLETRKDLVDCVSWWIPNQRGLTCWLEAAGFSKFDIDRQVGLTVDRPFAAAGEGATHNQVHRLIHALV